ncbi:MAG: RND multidrug efflux transporter [Candidatus Ozemobacter sibiricus]|uniref:RND multidrug efflux transporter n=1 Tax=Candidatus Ozemobacter sibiricus TaxID=2268124 RepID=A0A367ZTQ8_9BACT|nr:MAG: RND multidrug efflux transporter [Candidatus Ozemobacter sibiricus]
MNPWTWSVRHPIGITMVMLIVVIFGAVSLQHLPIDLMPDITYPTISLSAEYANASPVEVETLLTRPLEQALAAVPGVEELNSTSSEGRCNIRVTFAWGTDLDAAANDIRDRIDRILARLPDGVARPTLRKFDLANTPIMFLGCGGKFDPVQLLKLVEDQVKYRLERLPGVATVDIMGGRKREIHVNLQVERLKALGIRPDQVVSRLKSDNLSRPAGLIEVGKFEYLIRTPGEFFQVSQLRDVVIREDGATRIRLGEIADIEDRWERTRSLVRINGEPGLRISIQKQSGRNTVEVADRVLAEVAAINRDLPQLHLSPIMDSSKYIRQSIANVSSSAIYGGVLAIIVLLLFLGELRSTIVIAISIPMSIVATFVLMYHNGFTLNIMSLGGMALGIGMLVDNAIVVLENIFRLREQGRPIQQAAIDGAGEVAMPILASTLTTVVIFLPLLFVEGMTGLMFKQLAWIVGFSLLCSLVVALTLVPMLCAQILGERRPRPDEPRTGAASPTGTAGPAWPAGVLGFFQARYLEMLTLALRWPVATLLLVTLLLGAALTLVRGIPREFMPPADEADVRVTAEMEVGTRLSLMEPMAQRIEAMLMREVPERLTLVTTIGGGGGPMGGGNSAVYRAEFRLPLVPRSQRRRSSQQVASDLARALARLPGVRIRAREGQGSFVNRLMAGGTDRIQVQVRGHALDVADALASKVQKMLQTEIDGITDVQISREAGAPERLISIDRARAADQKLTVARIAEFIETLLSGTPAGTFRESGDEYRILVRARDPERFTLEEILDFTIPNAEGRQVPLRQVASIVSRFGPQQIERLDQERIVNVTADPGGRALGEVLAEVSEGLRRIPLPNGFALALGGDYQEQQKAYRELLLSFILALLLVYMVMAVQYEALLDPLIVMFTVPLSAIGVILALVVTGSSFNVQSFIGCIMLGGIVVNNSILLVDHANDLTRQGRDVVPALLEAGLDRFRPVLMTALTTILGLVPLALGLGEGGEVQAPMARVVIGGLLCSTAVSLLVIPAVYLIVRRLSGVRPAEAAGAAQEVQV